MSTTLESIRILETQLHAFYLEPIGYGSDLIDWKLVSNEILYVLDDVQYILQYLADAGIPEQTPAGHDITLPHRVRLLALRAQAAAQPVSEPPGPFEVKPNLPQKPRKEPQSKPHQYSLL